MSELPLSPSFPPPLPVAPPGAGPGGPLALRVDKAGPADAAPTADNGGTPDPFASLLADLFQALQPPIPVTGPIDPAASATVPGARTAAAPTPAPALARLPAEGDGTGSGAASAGQLLPGGGKTLPSSLIEARATALPVPGAPLPLPAGTPSSGAGAAGAAAAPEPELLPDLDAIRQLLASPGTRIPRQDTRGADAGHAPGFPPALPAPGDGDGLPVTALAGDAEPLPAPATVAEGGRALPGVPLPMMRDLSFLAMSGDGGATRGELRPTTGSGIEGSTPGAAADGLSRPAGQLQTPLLATGDRGAFAGRLADRLIGLGSGDGSHSARLRLHPENLGALDVDIRIDGQKAQVGFSSTSAQARELIEGSLPRLRELFAEQGITLTRTQVDTGTGGFGAPRDDRTPDEWPLSRRPPTDRPVTCPAHSRTRDKT